MKKTILYILLMITATGMVTSCSDDDHYQYGDFRYDMVTYMGDGEGYDGDVYINYAVDDLNYTVLIDPLAAATAAGELVRGDRVLLNYVIDSRNNDGTLNVNARGYAQAITDSLRYTMNMQSLAMDSVYLNSIWRTGEYINVYCRVKYTGSTRTMSLVMDHDTWHNDTVHCYLSHNMMGADAYFWRRCYASFYIGSVWNLQSCKTIRVHLNDVNFTDKQYYDFTKTN